MFLGQAARSATYQTAVLSRIEGVRVSDVMDAEPVAIPGDMTIGDALHEYFLRYRYDWFPVVDRNGSFSGSSTASAPSGSPRTASPSSRCGRSCEPRRTTCACARTTRSRRCSGARR